MPNTKERNFNRRSRSALTLAQSSVIASSLVHGYGSIVSEILEARHANPSPAPRERVAEGKAQGRVRAPETEIPSPSHASGVGPSLSRGAGEGFGERLVVTGGKTGGGARFDIERRLQRPAEMAPHTIVKRGCGIEAALTAQPFEPAHADRDMADLVLVDAPQHRRARRVIGAFEAQDHLRRHIEPARLQHQRHDREAG